MIQNLALIGSLPSHGSGQYKHRQIRVEWLLDLLTLRRFSDNFIDYRFDHLDDFIQVLKGNNLKPGFLVMGNPSQFFTNFEDETQLILWWELIKSIANRYITAYGKEYVEEWNFETWIPSSNGYDGLNMTLEGFMNYFESSYQGLMSASAIHSANLTFGGPASNCMTHSNQSNYCWSLVNRFMRKLVEETRLKMFVSIKSSPSVSRVNITESLQSQETIVKEIRTRQGQDQQINLVNIDGDPDSNWSSSRVWKSDATYAALVVKNVAHHIKKYFSPSSDSNINFSLLNFNNGHLSYYPHQFNGVNTFSPIPGQQYIAQICHLCQEACLHCHWSSRTAWRSALGSSNDRRIQQYP